MKILLTGSSGFLGTAIKKALAHHELILPVRSEGFDLTAGIPELPAADWVIHAAGKAHTVPQNKEEAEAFFISNVKGTENLLSGLAVNGRVPASFIFISSVAVYGMDNGTMIDEGFPRDAVDPYGKSKALAEILVEQWCERNNVMLTILRLPLLVGPNPPGNLGAMIRGIKRHYYFNVANGKARRSMVFAADVAEILPSAALIGGIYNLTDGYHPSFYELSSSIARQLKCAEPRNLPLRLARILAAAGSFLGAKFPFNNLKLRKLTTDLTFDDQKARISLNWNPRQVLLNEWIK